MCGDSVHMCAWLMCATSFHYLMALNLQIFLVNKIYLLPSNEFLIHYHIRL